MTKRRVCLMYVEPNVSCKPGPRSKEGVHSPKIVLQHTLWVLQRWLQQPLSFQTIIPRKAVHLGGLPRA